MGLRRWWTRRTWTARLVAVVVVALVGAGVWVVSLVFEDDPVFSLCPPNRSSTQVVTESQMIEEAAAYTGRGPHRLIVDGPSNATDGLQKDWVPSREYNGRYRIDELQLVACEYQYAVGAGADVQTCPYTPMGGGGPTSTFTAQSAKYDYKVYEASTGKQLATFTIDGAASACARTQAVVGDSPQDVNYPADPDHTKLKQKLQPLVTANR